MIKEIYYSIVVIFCVSVLVFGMDQRNFAGANSSSSASPSFAMHDPGFTIFLDELHRIREMPEFKPLLMSFLYHVNQIFREPVFNQPSQLTEDLDKIIEISRQINIPESVEFQGHNVQETFDNVHALVEILKDNISKATNKCEAVKSIALFCLSAKKLVIEKGMPEEFEDSINQMLEVAASVARAESLIQSVPQVSEADLLRIHNKLVHAIHELSGPIQASWKKFMDLQDSASLDI